MKKQMENVGVGILFMAILFLLGMTTVAQDHQDLEFRNVINNLDLYGAKDWIDINRGILNDPRIPKTTRSTMLRELALVKNRLQVLRQGLGDSEVDRVSRDIIDYRLGELDNIFRRHNYQPTKSQKKKPCSGSKDNQKAFCLDKSIKKALLTPPEKEKAIKTIEDLLKENRKKMFAANRKKDYPARNKYIEIDRKLIAQLKKIKTKKISTTKNENSPNEDDQLKNDNQTEENKPGQTDSETEEEQLNFRRQMRYWQEGNEYDIDTSTDRSGDVNGVRVTERPVNNSSPLSRPTSPPPRQTLGIIDEYDVGSENGNRIRFVSRMNAHGEVVNSMIFENPDGENREIRIAPRANTRQVERNDDGTVREMRIADYDHQGTIHRVRHWHNGGLDMMYYANGRPIRILRYNSSGDKTETLYSNEDGFQELSQQIRLTNS